MIRLFITIILASISVVACLFTSSALAIIITYQEGLIIQSLVFFALSTVIGRQMWGVLGPLIDLIWNK